MHGRRYVADLDEQRQIRNILDLDDNSSTEDVIARVRYLIANLAEMTGLAVALEVEAQQLEVITAHLATRWRANDVS
jgi:hypothetical protein